MAAKWLQSTANTSSSFALFTLIQMIMVMSWVAAHLANDGGAGNVGSRLRGGLGGFATLAASAFRLPPSIITSCLST